MTVVVLSPLLFARTVPSLDPPDINRTSWNILRHHHPHYLHQPHQPHQYLTPFYEHPVALEEPTVIPYPEYSYHRIQAQTA
jgi:hypothetical protein